MTTATLAPIAPPAKPRIFSGIKPTGEKTLGNYAGGFSQYLRYACEGEALFAIVDLHSTTVAYDPADLRARSLDLAALLYASGLSPSESTIFVQSQVPAHAEGARLLAAATAFGELARMHQFKEKGETQEMVSLALFDYPCLMAADILLYQTDIVPIGDDQRQHLELARDVAQRFNSRYGETLKVPEGRYPEVGARLMDLQRPERKMGTSNEGELGVIRLLDEPDSVRRKLKRAVTDKETVIRYDPEGKPGVSNLLEILAVASGQPISEHERKLAGSGYGQLKEATAEAVVALLAPLQERYHVLRADEGELSRLLDLGAERARALAAPTLEQMYERMGFLRPARGALR